MYNSLINIEQTLDPLKSEPDSVLDSPNQSKVTRVCISNSPTKIEESLKIEPHSVLDAPNQSTTRREAYEGSFILLHWN
ncbi:hypothetical protein SOVF_058650 [Spinacia oleracea]|nr:hypothetical protein SOVF_058650 [Spinacia oleracea]